MRSSDAHVLYDAADVADAQMDLLEMSRHPATKPSFGLGPLFVAVIALGFCFVLTAA